MRTLCTLMFLALLCCLNGAPPLYAQDLRFEHIGTEHGLSNNSVKSIVQDWQGFIWIATKDGLNRYDGYNFVYYRNDPADSTSISDNNITALLEDRSGRLWIGTNGGGLNLFDWATGTFNHFRHQADNPRSLSSDDINEVYEDSQGIIWVGTDAGLHRMDQEDGSFARYLHNPDDSLSLSHNTIRTIYEDRTGALWIGTGLTSFLRVDWGGGLNRLNREDHTFTRYVHDPERVTSLIDNRVTSIFEDQSGTLWVGTSEHGLHHFDRKNNSFTRLLYDYRNPDQLSSPPVANLPSSDPSDPYISVIFQDRMGVFWVGTSKEGLLRYDPGTQSRIHYVYSEDHPEGLVSNAIRAIYEDRQGTLWIGTESGLNTVDLLHGTFRRITYNPGKSYSLSNPYVIGIHQDKENRLWVGTRGGGLNILDPVKGTTTVYQDFGISNRLALYNGWVLSIIEDRQGVLWMVTDNGLTRYDSEGRDFTSFLVTPDRPDSRVNNFWPIYEDRNGILWTGTYGGGLHRFDRKLEQFTTYTHDPNDTRSISSNIIVAFFEDRQGTLWIGTQHGLSRWDQETDTFQSFMPSSTRTTCRVIGPSRRRTVRTCTRSNRTTTPMEIPASGYLVFPCVP